MRQMFTIIMLPVLFFVASMNAISAEKPRVAVMPFEAGQGVSKPEAQYLTELVRTELIASKLYDVISNDQLETLLKTKQKKQGVGSGSCSSEKCIIDLGNALECEKMIVGSAAGAFGEFAINVKMLDVVKQKYEFAKRISIKNKNMFPEAAKQIVMILSGSSGELQAQLEKEKERQASEKEDKEKLVSLNRSEGVTYFGSIWRSVLLLGWGHKYANLSRGYVYGGLWAAAGGTFLWSHFDYSGKQDEYLSAADGFDPRYDSVNSARSLRRNLSFAFIGIYIITLADMLISGRSYILPAKTTSSRDVSFRIYYGSSASVYNFGGRREEEVKLIFNVKF